MLKRNGVTYLLRKLLPDGNWLIGKFETFNGNWKFIKKTTITAWNNTIAKGEGVVENAKPESLPNDLFPE